MSFRILGALEAAGPGGTAIALGPPKQRALLAILLLRAGELIPAEQLIELLWGDRAPRTAAHSIHIYISELRRLLEPILGPDAIRTRPPGYQLQVPADEIDASRFERLTMGGTQALASGERVAGVRLLQEALQLWRGPALSDFTYEEFAQPYIRRLHDLHLDAIETLAAAELEAGRAGEVMTLLEVAIREDPLRERSRELLMLALYRVGRHAEALRTFETLRHLLDEELGLDPSPALRRLQERIILHDPSLDPATLTTASASAERNPYKGLSAFTELDRDDFFGRTALIELLTTTLEGGARLLSLVGPSGSGKSSAIAAGLLPAVRDTWEIASIAADQGGLAALQTLIDQGRQRLLVAIDQFEEVFGTTDASFPQRFLELLVRAASDPHSRLTVVLAMRGDFYDRPLLYPTFAKLFLPSVVNILPMTVEELEEAVVRPAEKAGISIEPALIATLIADTADQPGGLPLLQYTLTQLYERRRGRTLSLAHYRELGGLQGVLSRRAEEAFGALDSNEQRTATQVFLRLVRPGRGTADSRRRVLLSELTDTGLDPVALSTVLDAYGQDRLLSFDRAESTGAATVEVAHEALLWEWDRLAGWIDRHRTALRRHETFVAALEEWEESGRDGGYLLTGGRLEEFTAWRTGVVMRLTSREEEFLQASNDFHAAQAAALSASSAEVQRLQRGSRNRLIALVATLVLLIGGAVAAYAALGDTPSTVGLLFHANGTVDGLIEAGFDRGVSEFGLIPIERDSDVAGANMALEALANEGPDLLFVFTLNTDVATAAARHPEIRFVTGGDSGAGPNVRNLHFADEEGAYLAGAAAALHSQSGVVGFVGGIDIPVIWRFQAGFEAGARAIRPDVEVLTTYLTAPPNFEGFVSPALGEAAARAMYADRADVIFHAAGDSGTGVFKAAADLSDDGTHLWAIGVDVDQYFIGGVNEPVWREHILTSMVKRLDLAVYEILADEAEGRFVPGRHMLGLGSGVIALTYSGGFLEPYRERLEALRDEVISGQVEVPCIPASRAAQAAGLDIAGCKQPS
ncbi:MAG TPA: BTAD domain-containing putative transcriptional regulator [Candidatus Limnocylindrales bacterium]|nr:BTAD domain-containing putative transcriptional regulator [Candidatus Limnocylindrales bacterium]